MTFYGKEGREGELWLRLTHHILQTLQRGNTLHLKDSGFRLSLTKTCPGPIKQKEDFFSLM